MDQPGQWDHDLGGPKGPWKGSGRGTWGGRHIYKNATTMFPTRPKYLYYASNNNWSVSENLNNMHA